jgi:hypothetical protein
LDILAFASFAALVVAWIFAPTGSEASSAVVPESATVEAKAA